MTEKVFDRETLLDLTVNVIPFGIMMVFFIGYLVYNPYGTHSVISALQFSILGLASLGLMVLTYYSGAAVSKAESAQEASAETSEAGVAGDEAGLSTES